MGGERHWVAVWTASPQGPYPIGNPSAQPDLSGAFPEPQQGASRQTLRMIVRPSVWGRALRIRFTNVFGHRPLLLSHLRVALEGGGGALLPDTQTQLQFSGMERVTIPAGEMVWSDAVDPAFLSQDPAGRSLAISFYVAEPSGPMTWHAKALQTSYVSLVGEPVSDDETGLAFPQSTTSWFFIDAVDMDVPDGKTIVAFGDSLTDGTFSTLNGNDRWPDVLRQRLVAAGHERIAVVNAGIGGNQIVGPAFYDIAQPVPGGPSALDRLERDVLSLSGLSAVIWLEGTNDCSGNGCGDPDQIIAGLKEGVARMRAAKPHLKIYGATLPGAFGATPPAHGSEEQDRCRRAINAFLRAGTLFDAVFDFEAATTDLETGRLKRAFVPDSTIGGPGDGLHPNRAGYGAMAAAIDLTKLD